MQVSVIIPCYNSGEWLESTVRGAAGQTAPPLEILCVDDASENDTVSRLNRLREEIGESLIVLRQAERGGIGAARNRGLREARGDWIALLDHDDLWLPEKLEKQASLAAESPEAVLLHSRCWEERDGNSSTRSLMHAWKWLADAHPFAYLFLSNFIVPCTVMLRREALLEAGGFEERMDRHGKDDIELWLRLAAEDARFAHTEEPLAVRRLHDRNFSSDPRSFLQGRYEVLREAFERDRSGARQLLASEAILRLGGILLETRVNELEQPGSVLNEAGAEELEVFLESSRTWLRDCGFAERLVFGFPAFVPLLSLLARKNRRPALHHAFECAAAARLALSHAGYLVAESQQTPKIDAATLELARHAANAANQAARRAFRRRAEFEARHARPLITRS